MPFLCSQSSNGSFLTSLSDLLLPEHSAHRASNQHANIQYSVYLQATMVALKIVNISIGRSNHSARFNLYISKAF